jgi:CRISPR-associated endonuclease/helicase Cas3
MEFKDFFNRTTGYEPYPYQIRLAEADPWPDLLEAPTGAGKTEAVVLAWLWRRRYGSDGMRASTPRRLVYCLPMRVLVEQTHERVENWIKALGLQKEIGLHLLMGGEAEDDWDLYPEREAVLIGTQDMLLSRALNRGYALSRYRWPVQFGLLNNDCLWVFDEVQLMGSGLATTAQLAAFREQFGVWGRCPSLWVSATLQLEWLATVDFRERANKLKVHSLEDSDWKDSRLAKRLNAEKVLRKARYTAEEPDNLTQEIYEVHKQTGGLTLVILNTVKKAVAVYEALKKLPDTSLLLLHSRFRPQERRAKMQRLQQMQKTGGIVVATQVIEAGVDISARVLFTELSPWASFVQRAGRCNRKGEFKDAQIFWIDVGDTDSAPYDQTDLRNTYKILIILDNCRVNSSVLIRIGCRLSYEHNYVIRQHDLYSLFSTETDLVGGYTDISNFVRNIEREADVYVYWRDFIDAPVPDEPPPIRDELCPVRLSQLRKFLNTKGRAWFWNFETRQWDALSRTRIKPGMTLLLSKSQGGYDKEYGWTGNPDNRPDTIVAHILPQDSLAGDLESEREDWVTLSAHTQYVEAETQELVQALEFTDNDWKEYANSILLSSRYHDIGKAVPRWQKSIKEQLTTIENKAQQFISQSKNSQQVKFVESFLQKLQQFQKLQQSATELWAKFPSLDHSLDRALISSKLPLDICKRIKKAISVPFLPGLRHEAASALIAWKKWRAGEEGWTALAVYLVACHHGKVRTVLRRIRNQKGEKENIFGVQQEDRLPEINGLLDKEQDFDLRLSVFGAIGQWNDEANVFIEEGPSWIQMVAELLGPRHSLDIDAQVAIIGKNEPRKLGPFRLAFLEALIRAADVRASRKSRAHSPSLS